MRAVARARFITVILVIGALATPVLANDAGSGGDAGDTFSTAVPLNATDATYYGNLSSTDTSDFYSFTMPNATGIAIGLTSPSTGDFDPYLYDSSETQIDYSFTINTYEEVSSNGTNVGGTTVYY
jgi:hypothetical protein